MSALEALQAEARSRFERGDLEGALEVLLRLVELEPHDADAINDLGTVYFALGQMQRSRQCYARALQICPANTEARENLRMLCRATGASPEAVLSGAGGALDVVSAQTAYDVSVVVPVRSGFDVLDQCLEALYVQSFPAERYEVLVVANGVAGAAEQELSGVVERWRRAFGQRFRFVSIETASIPMARNEGIARSRGRIILQTNADAVLSRSALAQHYAAHEGFGFGAACVVAGGREFLPAYLKSLFNYLYEAVPLYTALHQKRPRFLGGSDWFVTCNLSCMREAYERFGLYDTSFAWGSDHELGMRWEKQGARIYVDTGIVGYHLHWLSFEFWKDKCITATPHWFRRHMGMKPEELSLSGRQAVRDKLDSTKFDPAEVERELRRLERCFGGPESFTGESVMGVRARTLSEFTALLRPLLNDYRTYLQYQEISRRIQEADAAREAGSSARQAG